MSVQRTATLTVDGKILNVDANVMTDETDDPTLIVSLSTGYDVLDMWKKADPDHRNFGWISDEDSDSPNTAFVVWIDGDGVLQTVFVPAFFDGSDTFSAYDVDDLTAIAGIALTEGALTSNSDDVPLIREAMDEDGYITLLTNIDQNEYLEAFKNDELDEVVHAKLIRFGLPYDSRVSVLSVNADGSFRVEYVTKISEFLL